ncbi:MAG: pseudouridine synthase [Bacillota bacterium]|nr:pseudouridine synthase [Bacillota bacterium]
MAEDRRLNKFISDSGFCSRREADKLIAAGRVSVNGHTASVGERVPPGARVQVDGKPIQAETEKVYLAVYKPVGIVCTADTREPYNIVDYINHKERIYPIGRLDKDSEGLILMTSDGDIVNRILRAEGRHEKEYEVRVNKPLTPEFLSRMRSGVPVLGQKTLPAQVTQTGPDAFKIVLVQGLNRQIRRMCEHLGYTVTHLRRIRVMNITLGRMQPGHWRPLSRDELDILMGILNESK